MGNHVIEVKDLVKKYDGRTTVLNGISFCISEGAFAVIYGKSGCGKTTLLNIIGGLDRPTSGSVRIDGREISNLSENQLSLLRLKKIGFVFQDFNLLLDLTVRENVALPLRFSKKEDDGGVDRLLRVFDIDQIADEPANRISGGEAQRTAIARAMVNVPRILLADEPTGNLDEDNTENIIEVFERTRNAFGTTTVLATHNKSIARHSTLLMMLEAGHLELMAPRG